MNWVPDGIAWAEAHPIAAAVIGALALAVVVLLFRIWRRVRRLIDMAWRKYVAPRPVEDVLTVVAASIATGVSAQGMWRFSGDVLGLDGPLRLLLFAFIEVAIVTSAVRARRNMRENFAAGLDGIAVWGLTGLTAVLSSMDAASGPEAVFRLAAPLVAAWLWERGMAIERHRIRGTGRINWRLTPERVLVRLGLAETKDRTAQEVDAHRRLTRVALAAKRAKMLRETGASDRKQRAAFAKLDKAMDAAVEHTGLAVDKARQKELLAQIAALFNAKALTDAEPVSPWESAMPQTPVTQDVIRAITDSAYSLGRAEALRELSRPASPGGSTAEHQRVNAPVEAAHSSSPVRSGPEAAFFRSPSPMNSVPSPSNTGGRQVAPGQTAAPQPRDGTAAIPGDGAGTNTSPSPSNIGDRPRSQAGTKSGTVPRSRRGRGRGQAGDRPRGWDDVDELMPLGWRIVAEFQRAGTNLTRDTLRDAIRATGTKVSTTRATTLLQRLRAEAPAEPNLRTDDADRPLGTRGPSSAADEDETATKGHSSSGDDRVSSSPGTEDETGASPGAVPKNDPTNDTTGDTE
ncbi:hypothetical protein ACU635_14530 [[Actinomadura] parvosata]|uniref:hypothetical protein n=1 Tax=[Actinomadura] parvosata TaxID=1955412 RepID=UPI00406C2541